MRSRVARNCGYAGMGDLGCAVDYHVLSSYTDFQLEFAISLKGLCQLESMRSEVMQITFNCQNSIVFNA